MYSPSSLVNYRLTKCSQDEFYPETARKTPDYARMCSTGHYKRLKGLIDETNGKIIIGGAEECEEAEKFIPPTLVSDVAGTDSLMRESVPFDKHRTNQLR